MILQVLKDLDAWVAAENAARREESAPTHRKCRIRLLGQMALWEARVPLTLVATHDVDVYADYEWAVQKEFERLLRSHGQVLDPHGMEVWMPKETVYRVIYDGTHVEGSVADPDCVLLSKGLKAPAKNRPLLIEFLARGPSDRFVALAKKYALDLEQFT